MLDFEIATFGNVVGLETTFNAVAATMGGSGFKGLLRYAMLVMVASGIFFYFGSKLYEFGGWILQAIIFVTVLNMPIARVLITDVQGVQPPATVSNVPFVMAAGSEVYTSVATWLTQKYETNFGVPDELKMGKTDIGFGHRVLRTASAVVIRDPALRADITQFIKECTLYDLRDGTLTVDSVVGGTDSWTKIFSDTSPARAVTMGTLTGTPQMQSCKDAADVLKFKVDAANDAAQSFYGRSLFPQASTDDEAKALFLGSVTSASDYILRSSQAAAEQTKQAMFNNAWRATGVALPGLVNDPATLATINAAMANGSSAIALNQANEASSMFARDIVPRAHNWVQTIVIAVFPIIVVMVVFGGPSGGLAVLKGYFTTMAYLGLWPVMFAIINHLSLLHVRVKSAGLQLASGVPFQMADAFDGSLIDEQKFISSMLYFVPVLAGMLVKMGSGGMTSLGSTLLGSSGSTVKSTASQMASGNQSIGAVGMDNVTMNMTSANKYDTNTGVASGRMSFQMANGNEVVVSGDGRTAVIKELQNDLSTTVRRDLTNYRGTDVGLNERHGTNRARGAENARVLNAQWEDFLGRTRESADYANKGTDSKVGLDGGFVRNAGGSADVGGTATRNTNVTDGSYRNLSVNANFGGEFRLGGAGMPGGAGPGGTGPGGAGPGGPGKGGRLGASGALAIGGGLGDSTGMNGQRNVGETYDGRGGRGATAYSGSQWNSGASQSVHGDQGRRSSITDNDGRRFSTTDAGSERTFDSATKNDSLEASRGATMGGRDTNTVGVDYSKSPEFMRQVALMAFPASRGSPVAGAVALAKMTAGERAAAFEAYEKSIAVEQNTMPALPVAGTAEAKAAVDAKHAEEERARKQGAKDVDDVTAKAKADPVLQQVKYRPVNPNTGAAARIKQVQTATAKNAQTIGNAADELAGEVKKTVEPGVAPGDAKVSPVTRVEANKNAYVRNTANNAGKAIKDVLTPKGTGGPAGDGTGAPPGGNREY